MRLGRIGASAAAGAALALVAAAPVGAGPTPANDVVTTVVLADGGAQAFMLRPQYDPGGAAPLSLYLGYTEANVLTPEPQADGQASWYNFGIAETAAFKTREECTPEKNFGYPDGALERGIADVVEWLNQEVIPAASQGRPPVAPGPTLPCTERFPGFAQSRYPETATIPQSARDDLLTKRFCEDPASFHCAGWTALRDDAAPVATDGSFVSSAGPKPEDTSAAALAGLGDGTIVSVGFAASRSSARLEEGKLVVEAEAALYDVCLFRQPEGCGVHIDQIRERALAVAPLGRRPTTRTSAVVIGMTQLGDSAEEAQSGALEQMHYDYDQGGDEFHMVAASRTGGCTPVNNADAYAIADAGGILIAGSHGSGGGITLGGACARARISAVSLIPPLSVFAPPRVTPPERVVISVPPAAGPPVPTLVGGIKIGPPRVVTKQITTFHTREAPALRTARYWASTLGAMLLLLVLGFIFRSTPVVRPIARGLDRFARQFLRG
jgi:hypothetical protein